MKYVIAIIYLVIMLAIFLNDRRAMHRLFYILFTFAFIVVIA